MSTRSTSSTKKELGAGNSLEKPKVSNEDRARYIASHSGLYSRSTILKEGLAAVDALKNKNGEKVTLTEKHPIYKLVTLFEFENGLLLSNGQSEAYRTLAVNLSAELQKEYKCDTPSEKATAHLIAQNYVRTMELQKYITMQLDRDNYTDMSTRRLAVLEKAYDRACQQYSLSLMTLQSLRRPAMNVTVKAVTANIGQNQMIQENYEVKPK